MSKTHRVGSMIGWLGSALAVVVASSPAKAHGWYPWECYSDNDCAPIPLVDVPREEAGGFTLVDGRRISYRDLKPAPDGRWHLCEQKWPANTRERKILCIYGPVGGS